MGRGLKFYMGFELIIHVSIFLNFKGLISTKTGLWVIYKSKLSPNKCRI